MQNPNFHSEAAQFVADAERAFNDQDVDAAIAGYAPSAILEVWTEGIYDRFEGTDTIAKAWSYIFSTFRDFRLSKTLISADPDGAIVNEWNGSVSGKKVSYGLDLWWRNEDAQVTRHKIVAHGHVVPYASLRGKLRWLFVHPGLSVRAVSARRRSGL